MQFASIGYTEKVEVFKRGVTIWRPIEDDIPADIVPQVTEDKRFGMLRTIIEPFRSNINEPVININLSGKGIITFVIDDKGDGLHELPEQWVALQVVNKPRNNASLFVTPVLGDIDAYIDFRDKIKLVYDDSSKASKIKLASNPELLRLFIRLSAENPNTFDYSYFR